MRRFLVGLTVCMFVAMPAIAGPTGTVTMKFMGTSAAPYASVSIYADSDGSYDAGAKTGYEFSRSSLAAGLYKHDISAATGSGVYVDDPLYTVCIDLSQTLNQSDVVFDVVSLTEAPEPTFIGTTITADRADLLKELWGRHYSSISTGQQAAEFQLAVWEIVFETSGTYDIGTGSLLSTTYVSSTNTLLNSLDGQGPMANLVALRSANSQDVLATIPSPGAVLLGSLGTGLVGWLRRRKTL